ncbi:MAG TPA: hypothetical protein VIJ93_10685 [bacterium]
MTEPEKTEGVRVLERVEEGPKKNPYIIKILIGLVVVVLGLGSTLFWGRIMPNSQTKDSHVSNSKPIGEEAQYADIRNFAEKFTIMAFNVSYTDVNHQVDKVANLMSDNMMSYYQEAFLDPKWVAFLSDNKAYVSYQKIDRSSVESTDGTHYWVRVIGKNLFNSDARGPGSQIELPFHIVVVVKSENGKLIVTDFQRL